MPASGPAINAEAEAEKMLAEKVLVQYLKTVDSHAQRTTEFLNEIARFFISNDVFNEQDMVGLETCNLDDLPKGGAFSFIKRALMKANKGVVVDAKPKTGDATVALGCLASVLKKEEVQVHVDIRHELKGTSYENIARECLPEGSATDKLATEIAKLKKKNIANPFVHVDLQKFLPAWASTKHDHDEQSDEDNPPSKEVMAIAKQIGANPKPKKHYMNLYQWSVAFDAYTLAAQATGQLSLSASMAHRRMCMLVGVKAHLKGRKNHLGLLYDDLVRKDWSKRSQQNETLNLDVLSATLDEVILREAEARFDEEVKEGPKGYGKGHNSWYDKGQDKGKGKGKWWGQDKKGGKGGEKRDTPIPGGPFPNSFQLPDAKRTKWEKYNRL